MIIYNYDSDTKEYTYSCEASLDPQETINQGKDVYLIPDYATTVQPPTAQINEVIIYDNGWKVEADFRGQYIVNEDMTPVLVEEIGELPDGYIVISEQEAQKIKEDDLYYIISDGHLIENPNYEADKTARERQRRDALTLTPADVERALYKAEDMDFEDLKALIVQKLPTVDIKALAIEFRAKDFYRGAVANGIRLFDTIGALLGYSIEDIDQLFLTKELPPKSSS